MREVRPSGPRAAHCERGALAVLNGELPRPIWIDGILYIPVVDPELLAILRQTQGLNEDIPDEGAPRIRLDSTRRAAIVNGRLIRLTRIEFDILACLMQANGSAVSVDELLNDVWGWVQERGSAELVRTHMRNIRTKLAAAGVSDRVIKTIHGQGYLFKAGSYVVEREANTA